MKISRNSAKICRIPEIHFTNFVDLEKSENIGIWTQKSASIQPRTSCLKFGCGTPGSDVPQGIARNFLVPSQVRFSFLVAVIYFWI